jgi:hypothetical protein
MGRKERTDSEEIGPFRSYTSARSAEDALLGQAVQDPVNSSRHEHFLLLLLSSCVLLVRPLSPHQDSNWHLLPSEFAMISVKTALWDS